MDFACHIVYLLPYFSLDWKEYQQRFKSSHIWNEAKFSYHIHSLYSVDKNVSFESVEKMHKRKDTGGDKMNNKQRQNVLMKNLFLHLLVSISVGFFLTLSFKRTAG